MSRPRWIIDDTSKPGRVFCEHTREPLLRGELLAYDDAPEIGFFFRAPGNRLLCRVEWLDEDAAEGIVFETNDMTDSLAAALKAHEDVKRRQPAAAAK